MDMNNMLGEGAWDFGLYIRLEIRTMRAPYTNAVSIRDFMISGLRGALNMVLERLEDCPFVSILITNQVFALLYHLLVVCHNPWFVNVESEAVAQLILTQLYQIHDGLAEQEGSAASLKAIIGRDIFRYRVKRTALGCAVFMVFMVFAITMYNLCQSPVAEIGAVVLAFPFTVLWEGTNKRVSNKISKLKNQRETVARLERTATVTKQALIDHAFPFFTALAQGVQVNVQP